jgi:hypothetical protein
MKLVSFPDILRFYLPLVLNSQLMTLSGPVINLAVGRADDPKLEFAGYWVGFTLLLFIESPCLVAQQVTAAMGRGYDSMRRLLIGSLALAVAASVTVLLVALTPVGDPIFDHVVRTTARVEEVARQVLAALAPVPILISLRGVGNGLAIRERRTVLVARATLFRILALSGVVGMAVAFATGSGAMAGVVALETGLTVETIVVWLGVGPFWRRDRLNRDIGPAGHSFGEIARVAMPMVVSAFAWTFFRPLVNGILGRLSDPELAQAGFGVVMPLVLLTSSPLWTIQNVSLVLPRSGEDLRRILRFAAGAAVVFAGLILLIVATPLRTVILREGFALSPELERAVLPALAIIVFEPFFLAARSISQGILMRAKRTESFMIFSPLKVLLVGAIGYGVARLHPDINGTLLGTALFVGGDLFEGVAYSLAARRVAKRVDLFEEVPDRLQPVAASTGG